VPFFSYAKVKRGIATGDNDYFTFSKEKAERYSIGDDYLLPCVCHSIDVKKDIFTESDFDEMVSERKKTYLLYVRDAKDANVNGYVKMGVETRVNEKYLTSKRKPWYSLEKRPPSPIWVSVFNRSRLRFIRNEANVSNLTTFHCIYPTQNLFDSVSVDLLFAYLMTDTASWIFSTNSREYGNGLSKFEPNDLNNGMMLDIGSMKDSARSEVLRLYSQYAKSGERDVVSRMEGIFVENCG